MDELKEKLAGLGIPTDQIENVIETVFGFIKDKLPDGMGGIVDSLTGDGGDDEESILEKAKGLFGG